MHNRSRPRQSTDPTQSAPGSVTNTDSASPNAEPSPRIGGGDSHARCPYCHDSFSEDDDLSSCAVCSTLLHPECHAENGGCPILGCGGRGAEPLRPLRVPEK